MAQVLSLTWELPHAASAGEKKKNKKKPQKLSGHFNFASKLPTTLRKHSLLGFFCFVFLPFLGRLPLHMGGSQDRGRIGSVAASLHQGHSNAGSEPSLQPAPQLTATPDR